MKQIPNNTINLTVTSPPYDELRLYNGYSFDFESVAKELYRITDNGGVVVWVVSDATTKGNESGTSFKQALFFKEIGFNLHDTMIYEKSGGGARGSNNAYWHSFEYMFVFVKGKLKTFNPICDRENVKFAQGIKQMKSGGRRNKDGTITQNHLMEMKQYGKRKNIWKYNVGNNTSTTDRIAYEHPAIFPEKLAEDHIRSWSNENDIVFDPFMGSGTTIKMAKLLNRRYLGCDISQDYVNIANQRLESLSQ